ncbi:hypothetical protein GCM10009753_05050 [Streptantibioticus ferralitis]
MQLSPSGGRGAPEGLFLVQLWITVRVPWGEHLAPRRRGSGHGRDTVTGVVLSVVVPLPNWP